MKGLTFKSADNSTLDEWKIIKTLYETAEILNLIFFITYVF